MVSVIVNLGDASAAAPKMKWLSHIYEDLESKKQSKRFCYLTIEYNADTGNSAIVVLSRIRYSDEVTLEADAICLAWDQDSCCPGFTLRQVKSMQ